MSEYDDSIISDVCSVPSSQVAVRNKQPHQYRFINKTNLSRVACFADMTRTGS